MCAAPGRKEAGLREAKSARGSGATPGCPSREITTSRRSLVPDLTSVKVLPAAMPKKRQSKSH